VCARLSPIRGGDRSPCWGHTGAAVVDALEEGGYDLVVVPSRRKSALGQLVHDDAVREILHHSPVPVLVVPRPRHSTTRRRVGDVPRSVLAARNG
jgi:hypothetical protein